MTVPHCVAKRRLLILSCSARKCAIKGKAAAWDLYDGVAFRMLKRLQRERRFPENVDILILSAQHGLIRPNRKIAFYNLRMDQELAARQAPRNIRFLRAFLDSGCYREVFVFAGQTYLAALRPVEGWLPADVTLTVAAGGIGRKMQQAKRWLLRCAD